MTWNGVIPMTSLVGTCLLALVVNPTINIGAATGLTASSFVTSSLIGSSPTASIAGSTAAVEAEATLLADLVAFENHVGEISERVIAATVAVTLGRNEGTGVIVSPEGHILTVGHIFTSRNDVRARVILSDGRRVWAQPLGCNYTRDYGLLKLDGDGPWPHVEMGSSADARVDDPCFAVGHTGGLSRDRSAVLRWGQVQSTSGRFLRTDCAINKGDSGGPLFNYDGEVIGIHSRIYPPLDENYHVPIDICRDNWSRLIDPAIDRWNESRWPRNTPFIGVRFSNDEFGCLIHEVKAGFPAEAAGMKAGDHVLQFDGKTVTDRDDLASMIGRKRPGNTVTMIVLREGKQVELKVTLTRRPR